MEFLSTVMPIILCALTSILVIILIVLSIKLINTLDKVNKIADDVSKKIESLNGFFNIIDMITDKVSMISDKVVDGVSMIFSKIFSKRKNRKEDIEHE